MLYSEFMFVIIAFNCSLDETSSLSSYLFLALSLSLSPLLFFTPSLTYAHLLTAGCSLNDKKCAHTFPSSVFAYAIWFWANEIGLTDAFYGCTQRYQPTLFSHASAWSSRRYKNRIKYFRTKNNPITTHALRSRCNRQPADVRIFSLSRSLFICPRIVGFLFSRRALHLLCEWLKGTVCAVRTVQY